MIGVELCDGAIFAWAVRTLLQMFVVSVVNAARVVMVGCPVSAVGPTKIGVADEYTTGARDADGGTPGVWDTCVTLRALPFRRVGLAAGFALRVGDGYGFRNRRHSIGRLCRDRHGGRHLRDAGF